MVLILDTKDALDEALPLETDDRDDAAPPSESVLRSMKAGRVADVAGRLDDAVGSALPWVSGLIIAFVRIFATVVGADANAYAPALRLLA